MGYYNQVIRIQTFVQPKSSGHCPPLRLLTIISWLAFHHHFVNHGTWHSLSSVVKSINTSRILSDYCHQVTACAYRAWPQTISYWCHTLFQDRCVFFSLTVTQPQAVVHLITVTMIIFITNHRVCKSGIHTSCKKQLIGELLKSTIRHQCKC